MTICEKYKERRSTAANPQPDNLYRAIKPNDIGSLPSELYSEAKRQEEGSINVDFA